MIVFIFFFLVIKKMILKKIKVTIHIILCRNPMIQGEKNESFFYSHHKFNKKNELNEMDAFI